jgi:threonine synthase
VICATAEWTKFAPTLATALLQAPGLSDADALRQVAAATNQPVPTQIADIFQRPVQHKTQIAPDAIEDAILDFL